MENKKRKRIFNLLKILICIYCLAGIVLWQLQDMILLHPKKLKANESYNIHQPHKEVMLQLNEKEKLYMVQFFADSNVQRKGVVLYFHGNRENINRYERYAQRFTKQGYEVWMPDYPGFGKTTGTFSEERLYSDASLLYKMITNRLSADSVIIYGRSLGTGVASELASYNNCKRLILETPYYSMPSMAAAHVPIYPTKRMLHYQFPVFEYVQKVKAPVTVFHGTDDEVIPYRNSVRLKEHLKQGDQFISIKNGKHNNLDEFLLFRQTIDSLLK